MTDLFGAMGIPHEKSAPCTPQQNGAAEQLNRTTLLTKARAMLFDSKMPQKFWVEAIITACYLRNVAPTAGSDKTPWERFTGAKQDLSHLRVFGSVCFIRKPDPEGEDAPA